MNQIKKVKVALVNSPHLEGAYHHPLFPSLGLAYLAAVLEQGGHEVKIIDCPACNYSHENLKTELETFEPELIGIASQTPTIPSAFQSARVAKETCPDSKIIMGGPHATFADKQILTEEKAVDIIVRGEGEFTLLELAQTAAEKKKLHNIEGLTYR